MKPVICGEFGSISCEQGEQEKREGSDLLSNLHSAALGLQRPGRGETLDKLQAAFSQLARQKSPERPRPSSGTCLWQHLRISWLRGRACGAGGARLQRHRRRALQGRGGIDSSLPSRNEAVPAAQF